MTKARTLADFISDGSPLADGTISVSEVSGAAPIESPTFTGTASGTFSGPLTGNVTGDVTGDLTGDVNTTLIASPTLNATVNIKTTDANGEGIGLGIDADKKVRFYDDQGSSTKMYWNASTVTQKFEDNSKLAFGSSENLKLYHDGTNKLVGDLTQTGKLTTDATDLSALAATISDTAVDVFVYDTRKDSDGGAWRKRTQHTSWYNETLNTSTRGSRKEFPAVAVIVAENATVTIYDGDDPDLPMWMVFNKGSDYRTYLGRTQAAVTSVSALNGVMAVGRGNGAYDEALLVMSFIEDGGKNYGNSANSTWTLLADIANRNTTGISIALDPDFGQIVNLAINDVAMTVLPNAPIDAATGLPVPTIAVATDGGVSVIKDDGTVVDITHTASANNGATDISFDGNQISYASQQSGSSSTYWRKAFIDIPSTDVTGAYTNNISGITVYDARGVNANSGVVLNTNSNLGDATNDIKAAVHDKAVGFTNKLTLLDIDYYSDAGTPSLSGSMVAYTTSAYATGWMNGDIKLATLSDTDDTNVTGSELVTNGTFDSGVSGWNTSFGSTITWNSGSQTATVTSNGSNSWNGATQNITGLTVGKTYVLTADIITSNNWGSVNFAAGANSGVKYGSYSSWNGGSTFPLQARAQFTATATSVTVSIDSLNTTSATVTEIDNISVRLAEEDRSVNGNGLQVFGTVTKNPVATGADLVAYSGFSTSNYLAQPYNADLQFGTGDFVIMSWIKKTSGSSYGVIVDTRSAASSNAGLSVEVLSNQTLRLRTKNPSSEALTATTGAVPANTWTHFACVVSASGTNHKIYLNGKLDVSASVAAYSVNSSNPLWIGGAIGYSDVPLSDGSLALFRISATAPSPEQISKIYEDEKVLFQENAQATLYGSSDAVTALAYDDSTELLHVGTSAGRSVFQGLRRVDNTTDAVGAAISASNGLVAED